MLTDALDQAAREILRLQMFFMALPLAFGLLHLILFTALPRLRSNLYYGLFLLFIAAAVFLDFQAQLLEPNSEALVLLRLHRVCLIPGFLFGLRFIYDVFVQRQPFRYWYFAVALVVTGVLAVIEPRRLVWPLEIVIIAVLLEGGHVMIRAVLRRQEDTWLVASGFATFVGFTSYDILLDFGIITPFRGLTNAYPFGMVGVVVATSAFLARTIARTNRLVVEHERRAAEREIERRVLEAEVERTRAELEEARSLQLSLLPSALPDRPGLQVAVYMKTAAEVGGDYYDARESADGTLTMAIGDATGHGLRAGIMVAVAKSLFQGLRDEEDLAGFFNRCTRVLKPMCLGNLFMALTLVRMRGDDLTIAAAGMPPLLIYRAASNDVEQVTLKGMPLGAFLDFPYQQARLCLHPQDTLLLMTDGLPELFNREREMLGLETVKEALQDVAHRSAEEIIDHLRAVGETWQAGCLQQDDVTLLVLKAAPTLARASSPAAPAGSAT